MKLTLPRLFIFYSVIDIAVLMAIIGFDLTVHTFVFLVAAQFFSLPAIIVGYAIWRFAERDRKLLEFAEQNGLQRVEATDHGVLVGSNSGNRSHIITCATIA